MFNDTSDIDSSAYIVTVYQKGKYQGVWELQSVNIEEENLNFVIEGMNGGNQRTVDLNCSKEYKDIYVRLMIKYITKDKDERRDLIGVAEIKRINNVLEWFSL